MDNYMNTIQVDGMTIDDVIQLTGGDRIDL